jgi:DNA-binding LacI/PurR family transcriptional regulator
MRIAIVKHLMGNAKRATSRDVAKMAGVSRTTVSFVLNDVPNVQISEDTRRRVWQAADQLGYYPDASARSLARQRSGNVGVVLCNSTDRLFSDVFLTEILSGIHEVIHPQGYHILLEAIEDMAAPDAYIGLVRSRQVDGLIVSGPRSDDYPLRVLEDEGFPVVVLGHLPETSLCRVDIDNARAVRTVVDYLLYRGHRRIAFISQGPPIYAATEARLRGYMQALSAAGLPYDQSLVCYGEFGQAGGYDAMKSLLQLEERPVAVLAGSDLVALGALAALRDAGLRVPDDVALVGFDDVPTASDVTPSLTTVHLPAQLLGRTAAEMLMRLVGGEEVARRTILLDTHLVIRQSA